MPLGSVVLVTQSVCGGTPTKSVFQPLKVLQVTVAVDPECTSTPEPKLSGTSGAVRPIWLRVMFAPVLSEVTRTPTSVPAPVVVSPVKVTLGAPNKSTAVLLWRALPKPLPKMVLPAVVPVAPVVYTSPFWAMIVGRDAGGPTVVAETFMVTPAAWIPAFW